MRMLCRDASIAAGVAVAHCMAGSWGGPGDPCQWWCYDCKPAVVIDLTDGAVEMD